MKHSLSTRNDIGTSILDYCPVPNGTDMKLVLLGFFVGLRLMLSSFFDRLTSLSIV